MSSPFQALYKKYLIGSMSFAGVAKIIETWDAKVERTVTTATGDRRYAFQDMLMGEKFALFILGTISGPYLMPFKFIRSMNYIDMYFKGEHPSIHGYTAKRTFLDYVL